MEFSHFSRNSTVNSGTCSSSSHNFVEWPNVYFHTEAQMCCVSAFNWHLNTKQVQVNTHTVFLRWYLKTWLFRWKFRGNSRIVTTFALGRSIGNKWWWLLPFFDLFHLLNKKYFADYFNTRPFATTDYRKGRKYGGIRGLCRYSFPSHIKFWRRCRHWCAYSNWIVVIRNVIASCVPFWREINCYWIDMKLGKMIS